MIPYSTPQTEGTSSEESSRVSCCCHLLAKCDIADTQLGLVSGGDMLLRTDAAQTKNASAQKGLGIFLREDMVFFGSNT